VTSRELLIVRGTGRVRGTVTYGEIEIERGGQVKGDMIQR
jgi:cytoskeletal protein CcmA (bactofilin family)